MSGSHPPATSGRPVDFSSGQAPVLQLDSPRALVESVPHLVGFLPEDSMVMVFFESLHDSGRLRSKATVRVDLPPKAGAESVWAQTVPGLVERVGTDAVALVGWGCSDGEAESSDLRRGDTAASVRMAAQVFEASGVPVRDQIVVVADRFVSLQCDDAGCCPVGGLPWDPPDRSAVSAALAVHGAPQPLRSRADLQALTAPDAGWVSRVRAWRGERSGRVTAPSQGPGRTWRALAEQISRGTSLTVEQRGEALEALLVGRQRDEAVLLTLDDLDRARLLWEELTRSSPDDLAAAPAALVALAAALRGDGAAANVALDRAHEALDAVARGSGSTTQTHEQSSRWSADLQCPQDHPQAALVDNVTLLAQAGMPPASVADTLRAIYNREHLTRVWGE